MGGTLTIHLMGVPLSKRIPQLTRVVICESFRQEENIYLATMYVSFEYLSRLCMTSSKRCKDNGYVFTARGPGNLVAPLQPYAQSMKNPG